MQNDYSSKSFDELVFIAKDAKEAADAIRGHDKVAECKYLDQVNDACTEMHKRGTAALRVAKKAPTIPWGDAHLQQDLI